eukprot:6838782-Karenia_brevis.AAC.1
MMNATTESGDSDEYDQDETTSNAKKQDRYGEMDGNIDESKYSAGLNALLICIGGAGGADPADAVACDSTPVVD